jgi:hypothetical protein
MNLLTILLVTLSNDGYWLSGQAETVQVRWTVEHAVSDATFSWSLKCGEAELGSGRLALRADQKPATLRITAPRVRVRTAMRLAYRVTRPGVTKPIDQGDIAIEVHPDTLLDGVGKRLASKYLTEQDKPEVLKRHLFVWDRPEALPALLKKAGVEHTLIGSEADLSFTLPDILIVAGDRLDAGSDQQKLLDLAASGASVWIMNQTRTSSLAGYPLVRRTPPPKLAWQKDHPLTASLQWFNPARCSSDLWAIRLPADEPALEITWWPRETPDKKPAPIDALVASKTIGKGRVVLSQIPLGPWQSDPRSQLLLADMLNYMTSPVTSTPPPSRRPTPVAPVPVTRESNLVLP